MQSLITFVTLPFCLLCLTEYFSAHTLVIAASTIFLLAATITAFSSDRKLTLRQKPTVFLLAVAVILTLSTMFWIIKQAPSGFSLDFNIIYLLREENKETIYRLPWSYIIPAVTNILVPIIFLFLLSKNKVYGYVFCASIYIFFFGYLQHKILLAQMLIMIFFAVSKPSLKSAITVIALCPTILSVASFIELKLLSTTFISDIIIRRVFFITSHNTLVYIEHFGNQENIIWSNGIFSSFVSYPLDDHPAKVIGSLLGTGAHENASFIATGYMHYKYIGLILYFLIFGLTVALADRIANKNPLYFFTVLYIPFMITLTSADLLTSLLSHGLFFSIIFGLILPRISIR